MILSGSVQMLKSLPEHAHDLLVSVRSSIGYAQDVMTWVGPVGQISFFCGTTYEVVIMFSVK